MTVKFDTAQYEFSHGKPKGRGSWAFSPKRNPDPANADECWFSPGGMTYTEAKKWAKAKAKDTFGADAHGTVYVQP